MDRNVEEKLPQVVEDRLQEAYRQIRDGGRERKADMEPLEMEGTGTDREKKAKGKGTGRRGGKRYRNWVSIAAALVLIVAAPSVVYAAVVYFQKEAQQEKDKVTYHFKINYELKPGEYKVTAGYLPKGMRDQGEGKYQGEAERWMTVMPVYTTAELEKLNAQITVEGIEEVEHIMLGGMEADVITFAEATKNQSPTYLFLFNEKEGYVLEVIAGYGVAREELLEFAGQLHIEQTGEGRYETEEEKKEREKEERENALQALEGAKTQEALLQAGIPQDKVYGIGEELLLADGSCGYTVTGWQYLDGIAGFDEDKFFDYTRFDGWLKEDKTLKPYRRRRFDKDGKILEEELTEQRILQVDVKVHGYQTEDGIDTALDFTLEYVEETGDGAYTWRNDFYGPAPEEGYDLQMDSSAVYLDSPVYTEGESRSSFFFRSLEKGEDFSYTLLFVVDRDRESGFLLYPTGKNNSRWQVETETVKEIRDGLDGYIRLE